MSTLASLERPVTTPPLFASRTGFALIALAVASAAATLAGWLPLQFSVVTVFLFAGPHNWLEFRYFLTRLPARWGKLRGFFVLAFTGTIALTASFIALIWFTEAGSLDGDSWAVVTAGWDTAFLLW